MTIWTLTPQDIDLIRKSRLPSNLLARRYRVSVRIIEAIRPPATYRESYGYKGKLLNGKGQKARPAKNLHHKPGRRVW